MVQSTLSASKVIKLIVNHILIKNLPQGPEGAGVGPPFIGRLAVSLSETIMGHLCCKGSWVLKASVSSLREPLAPQRGPKI